MSDFLYECSVCHKQTVSEKAATIDNDHCCSVCAEQHNKPGKFQRYSCNDPQYFDYEAMGKALLLYEFSNGGDPDEFMVNDGWGYCGRFGKYLVYEDDQGFVTYDEFENEEKANKQYEEYYRDGWGASEHDIYISHDWPSGWEAWDGDSGKKIQVWARKGYEYDNRQGIDRRRILAAVSLHMRKTGYFPTVWENLERGNIRCISEEIW